jgi:hypothetical protein
MSVGNKLLIILDLQYEIILILFIFDLLYNAVSNSDM